MVKGQKKVEDKNVSENLIPIDKTSNEATVEQREEVQISGVSQDADSKKKMSVNQKKK